MIALADEDENELIPWKNFVPVAVDAIRTIYRRNLTGLNNPVDHDALKIVYKAEIDKNEQLLIHKFKENDTKRVPNSKFQTLSGLITLVDFKKICRSTKFLTPKEQNLILRSQKGTEVDYTTFKQMVYNFRFEIAVARIMDTNM